MPKLVDHWPHRSVGLGQQKSCQSLEFHHNSSQRSRGRVGPKAAIGMGRTDPLPSSDSPEPEISVLVNASRHPVNHVRLWPELKREVAYR